jgi:phosphate transport system protein
MSNEVRQDYLRKLELLKEDVSRLGFMADEAVARAMRALATGDLSLAQAVVQDDEQINRLRYYIEEHSSTLIALQQPTAGDLRTIIAAMYVATNLERIGDYASGIARLALRLAEDGESPNLPVSEDFARMALIGREMLEASLTALIQRDAETARRTGRRDDEVDDLYQVIYRQLIQEMVNHPDDIRRPTFLLWIAHKLERIADRVTNVCERVIYMVTGEIVEFAGRDEPATDLGITVYSRP